MPYIAFQEMVSEAWCFMSNQYISSIVTKYGDLDQVKQDSRTLQDIIKRQGTSLVIDNLAEFIGRMSIEYKLSTDEVKNLRESLISELNYAIKERT